MDRHKIWFIDLLMFIVACKELLEEAAAWNQFIGPCEASLCRVAQLCWHVVRLCRPSGLLCDCTLGHGLLIGRFFDMFMVFPCWARTHKYNQIYNSLSLYKYTQLYTQLLPFSLCLWLCCLWQRSFSSTELLFCPKRLCQIVSYCNTWGGWYDWGCSQ